MGTETKWMLFECDNGRRWASTMKNYDGEDCNFSGCVMDGHKCHLIKTTTTRPKVNKWFRPWPKWEDTPQYRSLTEGGLTCHG